MVVVLSGTSAVVLTGTEESCHQEPKLVLTYEKQTINNPLNYANIESYGFLLTNSVVVDNLT